MTNIIVVKNEDARNLAQGSAWRAAFLIEYGGTYRLIYAKEISQLSALEGKLPKTQLEYLRGQIKNYYQEITPTEIDKLLRAVAGQKKYEARTATGNYNPSKTNVSINRAAGAAKHIGRIFVVVMLATELEKIRTAEDWRRQLGSSSSGMLGATLSGWAAGAVTGLRLTKPIRNPWVVAGSTIVGGIIGGAVGYEIASGFFEYIYDAYLTE